MTGLQKLLTWKASGGSLPQTETVSGSLVTFSTTKARPLKQCTVEFLPVQSGSGDPSPTNIMPISGRTGLSVYVSPTTTGGTEYPVSWQEEAGTVYAGTVDVITGTVNITKILWTKNTADMNNSDSYPGWKQTGIAQYIGYGINGQLDICNICPKYRANTKTPGEGPTIDGTIFFWKSEVGTQSELIAQAIDVQLIVPLQNPIVYQIDPVQIKTLIGTNNIWSDAGNITVTYTV